MAPVTPFLLDKWSIVPEQINTPVLILTFVIVREHKPLAPVSLHDSCVNPLSLIELLELSGNTNANLLDLHRPLGYGAGFGSRNLREAVADMYCSDAGASITWEDILVTQGTISANFLVLNTLCGPDDHVICQYPTYQQLYEVPQHAGAEVTLWKTKAENNWIPDVSELEVLHKKNTKIIIINNPGNPTGAAIPLSVMNSVVAFASEHNITILCDEVFRPLFHSDIKPPSILSLGYSNVISTGSTSKALALPGIRVGWITSPNKAIIAAAAAARDYTTITVSQLDDQIACFALSEAVRMRILARSRAIATSNLDMLEAFVAEHSSMCSWVRPTGGAVAFVRIAKDGVPVEDKSFCQGLLKETSTLLVPGGFCFGTDNADDYSGYLRIGFVSEKSMLEAGLAALGRYLQAPHRA